MSIGAADPLADRSVRTAWAADAGRIAAVQLAAWQGGYATLLPAALLAEADVDALTTAWESSLRRAPSGHHRVLVALDRGAVMGFVALAPSEDPDADRIADGDLVAFHVDPSATGLGHGSRLLAATVDTARAVGFRRLRCWVFDADAPLTSLLTGAGWAADGAVRELAVAGEDGGSGGDGGSGEDGTSVRQLRLHTDIDTTPISTTPIHTTHDTPASGEQA